MRISMATLAAAAALLVGAAPVRAGFVTFTNDTAGAKANGFFSAESTEVSFTDTSGSDLSVGNFGAQSIGLGLLISGDDASFLRMDFTSQFNSLSLVFGNDDPAVAVSGLAGQLTLFDGLTQVGQVFLEANRNDIADQTISYSGVAFNRATFGYVAAVGGSPANLAEAVDNIQFSAAAPAAAVPAPPTLLAALFGAPVLGFARRLRRREAV